MEIEKFKSSIRRLIKKGRDNNLLIEDIKKIFEDELDNVETTTRKKSRKKTKKICRPVMMISDSSCDEMPNYRDSATDLSNLSNSFRLPTND